MLSMCPYLGQGKMEPSWVCFVGALIPFKGTRLSRPKNFLNSLSSQTTTLGIWLLHVNGGYSFMPKYILLIDILI